ncbi:hypothetical protein FOZ63_005327, partial [Perkinsus olseni]
MALTVGILNPMDVIKVRMQTSTTTRTLWATVKSILHRDGVKALFLPGLKSSMASDFVNGAFRVGLYPEVKGFLSSLCDVPPTSLPLSLGSSFLTGIVGSFLGNPFDLIKIRSQYEAGLLGSDGRYLTGRCMGSKPTYPSVWTGVYSLLKDGTLFRGAHATCLRAGLVTCAQVSGFEQTKRACAELGLEDGILTRLVSGVISGLLATTVAAPVDLVRTRLMSSATSFPSLTSTVSNIIRAEGVRGLFGAGVRASTVLIRAASVQSIDAALDSPRGCSKKELSVNTAWDGRDNGGDVSSAMNYSRLSGGLGIAATAALLNPIEVLKVRMQTQQPRMSLTTIMKST